jgi:predicted transglutaminase-like cysteine proteinase
MALKACLHWVRRMLIALGACACFASSTTFALEFDGNRLQAQAQSRYGAKAAKTVGAWLQLLRLPTETPETHKLNQVNDFWNQNVRAAEDAQIWQQPDYWATPLESLGRGLGDCEDYVIGKYFSLVAMGVAPEKLRFVYVRARLGGSASSEQVAHMVLGYYPTAKAVPLVLDNLISTILPASQRRDLTPVFSFNAQGVYVEGKAAAPVDRIGRWRDLLLKMEREGLKP